MDTELDTSAIPDSLIGPVERAAIMKVLSDPPQQRLTQELAPIFRLLQKIDFVAGLDLKVQEELAKIVNYVHYDPYTVVCKQVWNAGISFSSLRKSYSPWLGVYTLKDL